MLVANFFCRKSSCYNKLNTVSTTTTKNDFSGGGTKAKFKIKRSLRWSTWFHFFRPIFLKWG